MYTHMMKQRTLWRSEQDTVPPNFLIYTVRSPRSRTFECIIAASKQSPDSIRTCTQSAELLNSVHIQPVDLARNIISLPTAKISLPMPARLCFVNMDQLLIVHFSSHFPAMQHFVSIHYLRAIAALMVAIFHVFHSVDFMRSSEASILWLRGGVDVFFVISGFVMVQSTAGRQITPSEFMLSRVKRIVPMYWLATFAMMMQVDGQWGLKAKSLLFIPAMNPKINSLQPVLEPGWTLNYEMFFYLVFALTLLLKEAHRFITLATVFAASVLVGCLMEDSNIVEFYTRSIILEFILGMAIAQFGLRLPVIAVPLGFVMMLTFQSLAIDRLFIVGVPAAFIVAGALSVEDRLPKWRFANLLGSASYSIYLFHMLVLGTVVQISLYLGWSKTTFVAVAIATIILAGCGIYWALERPVIAFFVWQRDRQIKSCVAKARRPSRR
jgi:exopolysaccharide production protein ExoZ